MTKEKELSKSELTTQLENAEITITPSVINTEQPSEEPDTAEKQMSAKSHLSNLPLLPNKITADTLKIPLGQSAEEKWAWLPQPDIHSLVLKKRKDALRYFLSMAFTITFLTIWFDREYAFAGIMTLLGLLTVLWTSTHLMHDIISMRMLMKAETEEEKNKKWYKKMRRKNIFTALFSPLVLYSFYAGIIGFIAIIIEIFLFGF